MTKKIKYSAFFFIGFVIIALLYCFLSLNSVSKKLITSTSVNQSDNIQKTTLSIDYGDGYVNSYVFDQNTEGRTVFNLLKDASENQNFSVDTTQYDFGVFVESINGYKSSADKAWIYFVNGESGQIAADQMQVKNGDFIQWKYIPPSME